MYRPKSPTAAIFSVMIFAALSPGAERDTTLTLTWLNGFKGFEIRHELVAREVENAFAPTGWTIAWQHDPSPANLEKTNHIRVVLVDLEPTAWKLKPTAMGVTPTRDRSAVYIFVPSVLRGLGIDRSMKRLPNVRERYRIAVALGRVVAHEIVHAIVPSCSHTENGIMRDRLHADLLGGQAARFSEQTIEAIRRMAR